MWTSWKASSQQKIILLLQFPTNIKRNNQIVTKVSIPPPLSVCWFVWYSAGICKNYWTDFPKTWAKKEPITFWSRSGQRGVSRTFFPSLSNCKIGWSLKIYIYTFTVFPGNKEWILIFFFYKSGILRGLISTVCLVQLDWVWGDCLALVDVQTPPAPLQFFNESCSLPPILCLSYLLCSVMYGSFTGTGFSPDLALAAALFAGVRVAPCLIQALVWVFKAIWWQQEKERINRFWTLPHSFFFFFSRLDWGMLWLTHFYRVDCMWGEEDKYIGFTSAMPTFLSQVWMLCCSFLCFSLTSMYSVISGAS